MEAVVLCLIGGAFGIVAGAGIAFMVNKLSPLPASVSPGAVLAAITVFSSAGLFFGLYPACP